MGAGESRAMPGFGYNTFTERLSYKPCISYKTSWSGSYQTTAHLHQPIAPAAIEGFVGRKLLSFGGLKSRNSAVLLSQLVTNHPKRHFQAYGFKVSGLMAKAQDAELSGDVWQSGDAELILARCGGRFVRSATYGGVLVVGFYFDFPTQGHKREFVRKYDLSHIGIETLFSAISAEDLKSLVKHLGIVAFQWGGDTSRLYNLTAGQEYRCRPDRLENCRALTTKLVDYVVKTGGFRDQITGIGPEKAQATTPLARTTEPYSWLSEDGGGWQWPPDALAAKQQTLEVLGKVAESQRLVASQLSGPMMAADRRRLDGMAQKLARYKALVLGVVSSCKAAPASCSAEFAGLPEAVRTLNPDAYAGIVRLDVETICRFPERFGQVALDLAKLWAKFELDPKACSYNHDYLRQVRTLNLSGMGLRRIDFLASLPKLERLDLSGNNIADGQALLWLDNIRYLDISRNEIKGIQALRDKFERDGIEFKYDGG